MRDIRWQLTIAWDQTNFVDESARLYSAEGESEYFPPEEGFTSGRGKVDGMTLVLNNADGRFSPFNTSGALYTYLQSGKAYHAPVRLSVSINGGTDYYRIFTGVIKQPEDNAPSPKGISLARLECRTKDELLLQQRLSTTSAEFQQGYTEGWTENNYINAWLEHAGTLYADRVLSPGLFSVPFAWLDDESPLQEIWKLAATCGGRFYCSNDGEYWYESLTHWITVSQSTTSQETIDESEYETLTPIYDDRELYNEVSVEASPRVVSPVGTLWEPDETVSIPANSSRSITAHLRQPAYRVYDLQYGAATAGGKNRTSNVTVSQTNYAQRVLLTLTNSHTTDAVLVRPMRIVGHPVTGEPSIEETANSTDNGSNASYFTARGNRTRRIQGNVFIQSRAHAALLARMSLARFEFPRVSYRIGGCPGNPQRVIGNLVTLSNSHILSSNRNVILTSVKWRLDRSGFKQDLEAIDQAQLFPWYPSPGYFFLNTDILDGSKRIFF